MKTLGFQRHTVNIKTALSTIVFLDPPKKFHVTFVICSWNTGRIFLYSAFLEHYFGNIPRNFIGRFFPNIPGIYHGNVPRMFHDHIFAWWVVKKNVSTSWLLTFWHNYYSLATFHHFLYVHIGFWILRIAIRPNWNNYHNITNAPTSLHLRQLNGFLTVPTSFLSSQIQLYSTSQWPNYISLLECKLVSWVLRRVDIGRIYSWVTQNLKFDWSIQIMYKRKVFGKSDLFE